MNKAQLLLLDQLSSSTVSDVKGQSAALYQELATRVADQRKAAVLTGFKGVSAALAGHLAKVDFSTEDAQKRSVKETLLTSLKSQGATAVVGKEAVTRFMELERSGLFQDPALPNVPLSQHPLFQADLQAAKLYKLADVVQLDATKSDRLVAQAGSVLEVHDGTLSKLVADKTLSDAEAVRLGTSSTLHHVTDGQTALVEAIAHTVNQVRDIAKLSAADWARAIDRAKVTPPEGKTKQAYAAQLRSRAAALFPTDAFYAALDPKHVAEMTAPLEKLSPLLARAPDALRRPFETLDLSGLANADTSAVRDAHAQVQTLANTYPGLGLEELLSSQSSAAEKVTAATAKLGTIGKVLTMNPDVELLALDYSPGSRDVAGIKLDGLTQEEKHSVLSNLKTTQRAFALTGDVDTARTVLAAGYRSALAIAAGNAGQFSRATGLANASAIYGKARSTVAAVTTGMGSIIDVIQGGFSSLGVGNIGPSTTDYLKQITGFSELFGSQSCCSCQECQSILGPAAYFVDLMAFIEENVTNSYFAGAKGTDVLNLKVRRPDLWTLQLTCENTNQLVPYLTIINEILENYVAGQRGYAGALDNRAAVEKLVYQDTVPAATDSIRQPFVLPVKRLETYLGFFQSSRAAIARTMAAPPSVTVPAALKLSDSEYHLVVTANTDMAFLRNLFGVSLSVTGSAIDPFDVQLLVKFNGFTRAELGDLLGTAFVKGTSGVAIVSERSSSDSVQNDIERVHNASATVLDRLHRFTRLARRLSWSIQELDVTLALLSAAGLASGLETALPFVTTLLSLQERFGVSVEQLGALYGAIPTVETAPKKGSLFDRLFNYAPFVATDGPFPRPTVKFIHPSFRATGTPLPADNTLHRLLGGLGVADVELSQLITSLAPQLGINLHTSDENDRGFLLSLANLTLLYRHARIFQLLKLKAADLFQLVALSGIASGYLGSLSDLTSLLDFYDFWKGTDFKLDDLAFITRGAVRDSSRYPDRAVIASQIVSDVANDKALEFADTVFAYFPSVTEDQSRAIVSANAALFEPSGGALRLANAFSPTAAIVVPAGIPVSASSVMELLLKHHASTIVPARLAHKISIAVDLASTLLAATGADLSSAAVVTALEGGARGPLEAIIDPVLPLSVLFKNPVFDAAALTFLRAHAQLFAITDFKIISMASVQKLAVYVAYTDTSKDDAFGGTAADPASVQALLAAFDPASRWSGFSRTTLAAALRVDAKLVATLLPNVPLPATAPEALAMLGACALLAIYLGVDGQTLKLAAGGSYTDLAQASDALLSAFRTKCASEQEFEEKLGPYEDVIREAKRDSLTEYLIRSLHISYDSLNQLYEHFLVDVQLCGCAKTSRLVAAISSVQLYVYRCLMNLEQDRRDESDPAHIHVLPGSIPASEWTWRKNYRVWEANRKVFLFPESYIEPELRDDKTPLFKDLESTLLQQQITEQNVLDAYGTYVSGFDELAKVKVAGCFHDKHADSRTDLLHLFGVTPSDPPLYYYRTIENAFYGQTESDRGVVYSAWRKIDVQIPVRKVAPIVYLGRLFVFWTEVTTTPKNQVTNGGSVFVGYKHRLTLKFTSLRLDGTWTPPQAVTLSNPDVFSSGDGIVDDPLAEQSEIEMLTDAVQKLDFAELATAATLLQTPRYDTKVHLEPIDSYTLSGFQWDQPYPDATNGALSVTFRNFILRSGIDFYRKTILPESIFNASFSGQKILCSRFDGGARNLYYGQPWLFLLDTYPHTALASDQRRIDALAQTNESSWIASFVGLGLYSEAIARIQPTDEISVINGALGDAIFDSDGDLLYLQGSVRGNSDYVVTRLGTTLTESLSRTLFTGGVGTLLSIDTQKALAERPVPWVAIAHMGDAPGVGKVDYTGSLGTYFREIYFHVPFLIAKHLNTQQSFEASQRWYSYVFDPTSDEQIALPAGLSAGEKASRLRDRVWRYLEFRGLAAAKLRDVLTDPKTIETYKKDPFNPHAIARLRLSAYQKCIVMKYIDNLLDWGDSLFSQFTTESVNEATMLYVMAADILGPRPADLGDCGEGAVSPKTYETIRPFMKDGSEFLVELETLLWVQTGAGYAIPKQKLGGKYAVALSSIEYQKRAVAGRAVKPPPPREVVTGAASPNEVTNVSTTPVGLAAPPASTPVMAVSTFAATSTAASKMAVANQGVAHPYGWKDTRASSWSADKNGAPYQILANDSPLIRDFERIPNFGWSLIRQLSPAFCVPQNKELLAYWNRVDDRLYKIRNCLDITGAERQLALFAPEIDPRLLVNALAGGLSLDDVINATSGNLPPYRFAYVIEKAKQYAASVQGFGSQLLAALEKKDIEDLTRLRTVHQQNLLKMSNNVRNWEIDIAADTILQIQKQQEAVTYRQSYYQGLVDNDLTAWERTQQVSRHAASGIRIGEATLGFLSGVLKLLPQLGSPFAMKYGGVEVGGSLSSFAVATGTLGAVAEAISQSAGLEAGFERRKDGWQHQVELAKHELAQLDKSLAAATVRKQIAERSLEIHQKSIEQLEEVFELMNSRFSNLALYSWYATTLQRVFRQAYSGAYAMARLAEQAYRFERSDDTTQLLAANYWDPAKSGLLAGEQLLSDLQGMERQFIETNYRQLEIDQSFSLTQVAPAALADLRERGSCVFELAEVFFDLHYPGQFRRRIKNVRLTIPCVTGPYTNVGATLTLTSSQIRKDAKLGASSLLDVPPRRSVSVAASTAQNDSGVFEFSFRDERYMPFEGAGAVSSWSLSLPKTFRQFDYQSINDVIVHVSYTADYDALLKTKVETENAATEGTILNILSSVPLARYVSLRQDLSGVLHRVVHSAANTPVKFELTDKYLPFFVRGRTITVTRAALLLRTPETQSAAGVQFDLDGITVSGFTRDSTLGDMYSKDVAAAFAAGIAGTHQLTLKAAGDLAPATPAPGDASALDGDKLLDVALYLEYQLA